MAHGGLRRPAGFYFTLLLFGRGENHARRSDRCAIDWGS